MSGRRSHTRQALDTVPRNTPMRRPKEQSNAADGHFERFRSQSPSEHLQKLADHLLGMAHCQLNWPRAVEDHIDYWCHFPRAGD